MGTSYFLWRLAGLGVASELLLTGRPLAAERAYQVREGPRAQLRLQLLHGRLAPLNCSGLLPAVRAPACKRMDALPCCSPSPTPSLPTSVRSWAL